MLRWPLLADHLLQLSLPAEADRKVILVQPHTNERAELDRSAGARSLKAAKAHGVVLGNPKLDDVPERAVASTEAEADRFAKNVVPIIRDIQSSGAAETSQQ